MERFSKYVEELTTKGSDCAIAQSAKDVLAKATEVQTTHVEFSKRNLSQDRVAFEAAKMSDIIHGPMKNKLLGSITVNGKIGESMSFFTLILKLKLNLYEIALI